MESKKNFIINIAYLAIIIAIVFLVFKYLLNLVMPFFLALIFASLLRPLIRLISKKMHIREKPVAAVCTVLFFAVIGGIIVFVFVRSITRIAEFIGGIPQIYTTTIEPGIVELLDSLEVFFARFNFSLEQMINDSGAELLASLGSRVTTLSVNAVAKLTGLASKLPSLLLSSLICVISTMFMSIDYERMSAFLLRLLPERAKKVAVDAKNALVSILVKYGKSYALIMLITFGELSAGLLLIGIRKSILIAALIAVFDIFPIVGAGLVLLPWTAILFFQGRTVQGVCMLLLYVIIVVVRQIIEPKIVGKHVGLHPLLTLMGMFVGTSLFGGIGLFGLPILLAIIKNLDDTGAINLFNRPAVESENINK